MGMDWLLDRLREAGGEIAVVWRDAPVTYGRLLDEVEGWRIRLDAEGLVPGTVVSIDGDFSPRAIALLLELVRRSAIVVPLTASVAVQRSVCLDIAEVQRVVTFDDADGWTMERRHTQPTNPLTRSLIERGEPGLVLFTSGSTGASKAALHDFTALLGKFRVKRQRLCTMTFLLLDHIGGINTLFYTLSNGGTVVSVASRDPEAVCRAIEAHEVALLPTTPTFLNLLLASETYRNRDLSSLRRITYGTEVMPETTLRRVHEIFPNAELLQTYGLTEVGILRSRSRDSGSLWLKVGGEGFETKVVDGLLWIRAKSAMLGYLNAPSPFDAEGWFNTGDVVEVDGEYIRIFGRRSEIINVGGQKVYPAEVESVLMQMPNVQDVTVFGERNLLMGQIVAARVNLHEPESADAFKARARTFCGERLAPYKVPVKIVISSERQYSERYKKKRAPGNVAGAPGKPA